MLSKRKVLGLAVTSRSATAVEVVATSAGGQARRAAVFTFPDGGGLEKPAALGKALKQFLRRGGFSASRCVIGMDANWLTARDKVLPPGASGSVREILSLMAEREFASDRNELVFDYALGGETGQERSALLVAAPRRILDGLTGMAQAAGLSVAGITVSTMALVGLTNGSAGRDQLVLHLYGGGAELAMHSSGALRMMRRLPVSVPTAPPAGEAPANGWLDDLTGHLRPVVSLLPGPAGDAAAHELLVWDEVGLDGDARAALAEKLALSVKVCQRPPGLDSTNATSPSPGGQFSAAAAMALTALAGESPAVDLLHSRLAPQRRLGLGRKVAWAAGLVAALVVASTVLVLDWRSDSLEAAALRTKLDGMGGDLDEARQTIAKVMFARPWYDRRPSYMDCIQELTRAFPDEGLIWVTSLAVQEDMQVVFSGKAVSESAVLDVLDRLKANPKLASVQPLYIRQAGRQGREVAFAMSFAYPSPDGTWSSPSVKKSFSPRR